MASVSEDGVDPATKLGSSALVSEGGDVPESLALENLGLVKVLCLAVTAGLKNGLESLLGRRAVAGS